MIPETSPIHAEAEALCSTAHWCYVRGWVPATSGNFSVCDRAVGRIFISPSGLDKGMMKTGHLLETDLDGRAVEIHGRPSAESGLHAVIYRDRPEACAILHVHTIWNTLLSVRFAPQGCVRLQRYELLKALAGVRSHEHVERVPILENSQDYERLAAELTAALGNFNGAHAVLLKQHGLYTWGKSVAEARRHLEALEFLFEVEGRRLTGGME